MLLFARYKPVLSRRLYQRQHARTDRRWQGGPCRDHRRQLGVGGGFESRLLCRTAGTMAGGGTAPCGTCCLYRWLRAMLSASQAECREFDPPRPLCLPPMSHDDTGGFSLTNSAEVASSGDACGSGRIGTNSRTMTGNDLAGRSLVQARVQAQVQAGVQGLAGMALPISGWRSLGSCVRPCLAAGPAGSPPPQPRRAVSGRCRRWR
jgi:hypothetical protein